MGYLSGAAFTDRHGSPSTTFICTNQIKSPFHLEFDFDPWRTFSTVFYLLEAQVSGLHGEAVKQPVRARDAKHARITF